MLIEKMILKSKYLVFGVSLAALFLANFTLAMEKKIVIIEDPKEAKVKKTDIFSVVAKGDLKKVQEAIASGIDVNSRDGKGNTILIIASINNQLAVVKFLLDQPNINVNAKNFDRRDALEELEYQHLRLPHFGKSSPYQTSQVDQAKIVELLEKKKEQSELAKRLQTNNIDIRSELLSAVKKPNAYIVKLILNVYRFDPVYLKTLYKFAKDAYQDKGSNEFDKMQFAQIGRMLLDQLTLRPSLKYGRFEIEELPTDVQEEIATWL